MPEFKTLNRDYVICSHAFINTIDFSIDKRIRIDFKVNKKILIKRFKQRENITEKVGVFVSSGIGGLTTIQNQCEINIQKGRNRVSPMFIPMSIANMPAGNIAIDLNLKGESVSIVTACASSTHSIGEAYRTIKYGAEDVILAGGTESSICEVGIAGLEK